MKRFSFLFLVFIAFYSCSEKDEQTTPLTHQESNEGISLQDGALCFETPEVYFETVKMIGNMSDSERDNWEKSLGFKSQRRIINKIINEVINSTETVNLNFVVSSNLDIIKLQDGFIAPIIKAESYQQIVNRDGIYYVQGTAHKVIGEEIISSEDGNIQTINNFVSGLKSVECSEGIRRVSYLSNNTLKSGCGNRMSAYVEANKRKCDAEMLTFKQYCAGCCGNYYYQDIVQWISRAYAKNLWGNWKEYNTQHTYSDVAFTVSAPIVYDYNGVSSVFYYADISLYFSSGSTTSDVWKITNWTNIGNQVQNVTINDPSFSQVKGEFSTRGVGADYWAIINCGF